MAKGNDVVKFGKNRNKILSKNPGKKETLTVHGRGFTAGTNGVTSTFSHILLQ